MNRDIIMQMLQMLPPERLGQLAAQAVNPERVLDTPPNKKSGMSGVMMMNEKPKMYQGPIGRR